MAIRNEIVYLVEADFHHIASGNTHRFFFSTPPGFISKPDDTFAKVTYAPLLEQAADIELMISSFGEVDDATRVQIGTTILANRLDRQRKRMKIFAWDVTDEEWVELDSAARPLNPLITDYAIGGGSITILAGNRRAPRDTGFTRLVTTKMELPDLTRGQIILSPRDKALDFDTPALTETYLGTGSLEGTADMEGKTKERTFGEVVAAEPTYLGNITGGLATFSINGGHAIEGITAVYDDFVPLSEVTSGTPTATEWRQDKSNGTFWIGGATFGKVIFAGKGDKTGATYRYKGADLIKFWATTLSSILTNGDLNSSSFTALAAAAPYTLGFYLEMGSQTTLRELFDEASRAYRGYWLLDQDGKLEVGQVTPASGTPVRELRRKIDHTGLVPRQSSARPMPARAALIRFGRNYAPADASVLDTATVYDDARNFATTAWREAVSSDDATVVARYGYNTTRLIARDTPITLRADADTEAAALRDDAKEVRRLYDLPCTTLITDAGRLSVLKVYDDTPGFEDGKLVRVLGFSVNQRSRKTSFVVRD
jgi:hypothetical protein